MVTGEFKVYGIRLIISTGHIEKLHQMSALKYQILNLAKILMIILYTLGVLRVDIDAAEGGVNLIN